MAESPGENRDANRLEKRPNRVTPPRRFVVDRGGGFAQDLQSSAHPRPIISARR
jgi:hypothetical protein